MTEPISDQKYWKKRFEEAKNGSLHHAIFKCTLSKWEAIEATHRQILAKTIGLEESVLDAGCGWGRLLRLLPANWEGDYLGVDLSQDFINFAREMWCNGHHNEAHRIKFLRREIQDLSFIPNKKFDWSILISIRPMVIRNLGKDIWLVMLKELERVSSKILYLEYDETAQGEVYECS